MEPIQIDSIDSFDWEQVLTSSQSEGHNMVKRLLADFQDGANRFEAPGEILFVCLSDHSVIAVGGLNQEPDRSLPRAGRVRRLYVLPEYRGQGLARSLLSKLIASTTFHFEILTVNVGTPEARGFYEHLGFIPVTQSSITHMKQLTHHLLP